MDKEDILQEVERNADGTLESVEFDWIGNGNRMHKNWENTILGHLTISGRTLTVEVNSANRAERIRAEIEDRLGLYATHMSTTSRTPEEALAKRKGNKKTQPPRIGPGEPLNPEMQREFAGVMQEEVEAWVHKKIPALGGRTPLQAVADPDGREIVESLLLGWKRAFEGPGMSDSFRPDIDAVRRQLDLPVALGTVIH